MRPAMIQDRADTRWALLCSGEYLKIVIFPLSFNNARSSSCSDGLGYYSITDGSYHDFQVTSAATWCAYVLTGIVTSSLVSYNKFNFTVDFEAFLRHENAAAVNSTRWFWVCSVWEQGFKHKVHNMIDQYIFHETQLIQVRSYAPTTLTMFSYPNRGNLRLMIFHQQPIPTPLRSGKHLLVALPVWSGTVQR